MKKYILAPVLGVGLGVLLFGFLSLLGNVAYGQTTCPDCTESYNNFVSATDALAAKADEIAILKANIQEKLENIAADAEYPLAPELEENIETLLEESNCATTEEFVDIEASTLGVKGMLYNTTFFCEDSADFELFLSAGFGAEGLAAWATEYDTDRVADWEAVATDYTSLQSMFYEYYPLVVSYNDAFAAWQECTASLAAIQEEGECTEVDIPYEENEVPAEFNDPEDCPECNSLFAEIETKTAEIEDLQEAITEKNTTLQGLYGQLEANVAFQADLALLIEEAGCDTDLEYEEIELAEEQIKGLLYGQTFFCQDQESAENFTTAWSVFFETHTEPAEDALILEEINTLLLDIESLQDSINVLQFTVSLLSAEYAECLNQLLSLQAENFCTEVPVVPEDNTSGGNETPSTGGSGSSGSSGGGSNGGSGGSSSNVCTNGTPLFSEITPVKGSVFHDLEEIRFTVSKNVLPSSVLIKVNNAVVAHTFTKNTNGTAIVVADVDDLNLTGSVRIHLHIASGVSCTKDAIYLMTVDPNASEKNTDPGDEDDLGSVFSDADDYIAELQRRGIVNSGEFFADRLLNRAEAAKIIARSLGKDVVDIIVKGMPFPDVKLGEWFTNYIQLMKDLGILQGYADGFVRPERNISQAEARAMLYRATKTPLNTKIANVCNDLVPGAWYLNYMNSAYNHGFLTVKENGTCQPDQFITRGEFAEIVVLYFGFNN